MRTGRCFARPLLGVLVAFTASQLGAQPLEITGPRDTLGCDVVRGEMVAFLAPGRGIVLLGTRPFPAGRSVGAITTDRLSASVEGLGDLELELAAGPPSGEVFGLLDRSLEIGDRQGCFGFGQRRFSDIDDLKTYLHWWVRSVLAPLSLASGEAAPSVWLAGRAVTLEVAVAGHRPVQLRGTEGATFGFQPVDSSHTLFFQPFVVGRAGTQAAVRVSVKEGDYFGPGTTADVAFLVIGPDVPIPVPVDPPLTLRLAAIEAKVSFVN